MRGTPIEPPRMTDPNPAGDHLDPPSPEHALCARIRDGDRGAEAELVSRYGRALRLVLDRRVRDPELASDLYQETFRIVLMRLRSQGIDQPAQLAGFLQRTAANLAIGEFRKLERRGTHADSEAVGRVADPGADPFEAVTREQTRAALRRLIGELGVARDRTLLWRHYVHEADKATLCRELELSPAHFDRVLFRARQRLRALLLEAGFDGESR